MSWWHRLTAWWHREADQAASKALDDAFDELAAVTSPSLESQLAEAKASLPVNEQAQRVIAAAELACIEMRAARRKQSFKGAKPNG